MDGENAQESNKGFRTQKDIHRCEDLLQIKHILCEQLSSIIQFNENARLKINTPSTNPSATFTKKDETLPVGARPTNSSVLTCGSEIKF